MSFFTSVDENVICIARNNVSHNLSSFVPVSFELEGKSWSSVEHYFQAMKFPVGDYQESIRLAKTANKSLFDWLKRPKKPRNWAVTASRKLEKIGRRCVKLS